jgi:hypothetical protein
VEKLKKYKRKKILWEKKGRQKYNHGKKKEEKKNFL